MKARDEFTAGCFVSIHVANEYSFDFEFFNKMCKPCRVECRVGVSEDRLQIIIGRKNKSNSYGETDGCSKYKKDIFLRIHSPVSNEGMSRYDFPLIIQE